MLWLDMPEFAVVDTDEPVTQENPSGRNLDHAKTCGPNSYYAAATDTSPRFVSSWARVQQGCKLEVTPRSPITLSVPPHPHPQPLRLASAHCRQQQHVHIHEGGCSMARCA